MRYEDIETFLYICDCHGISPAAKALYLAQSTVSARLQRLEHDLGQTLVVRSPGVRKFMLTPRGEQFHALARRLASAWDDVERFPHADFHAMQDVAIGSIASVYEILLPPFFGMLHEVLGNPGISALVGTSSALLEMIDAGQLDYAFSSLAPDTRSMASVPVLRERYVLVCSTGLLPEGRVSVHDLRGHSELFYSWAVGFKLRHSMLRPDGSPYILCDTPYFYREMARSMNFWSICPTGALQFLRAGGVAFDVHDLSESLPDRVVYLLSSLHPRNGGAGAVFEDTFARFLVSLPDDIAFRSDV